MSDQAIPKTAPAKPNVDQLAPEWQMFFKELLRRVADLESRVTELEP